MPHPSPQTAEKLLNLARDIADSLSVDAACPGTRRLAVALQRPARADPNPLQPGSPPPQIVIRSIVHHAPI